MRRGHQAVEFDTEKKAAVMLNYIWLGTTLNARFSVQQINAAFPC